MPILTYCQITSFWRPSWDFQLSALLNALSIWIYIMVPDHFKLIFIWLKVFREIICMHICPCSPNQQIIDYILKRWKNGTLTGEYTNWSIYQGDSLCDTVLKIGRLRFKTFLSHENSLHCFGPHCIFQPNLLFRIVSGEKMEGVCVCHECQLLDKRQKIN